jgi:hypothetical protein
MAIVASEWKDGTFEISFDQISCEQDLLFVDEIQDDYVELHPPLPKCTFWMPRKHALLRVQRQPVHHLSETEHCLLFLCKTRDAALILAREWLEAEHNRFGCCVGHVRCARVACENDCLDMTMNELEQHGVVLFDEPPKITRPGLAIFEI